MHELFKDYSWKDGKPIGNKKESSNYNQTLYKIVSDPYYKRITIEKYNNLLFESIVYDSILLDFRKLKSEIPPNWNKVSESDRTILRDHDDRIVGIETYEFQDGFCRACHLTSPHGFPISTHKIFYRMLGDSFDGVVLYDSLGKNVMRKEYASENGIFGELLKEDWVMTNAF